jgi:hypothetical protein
MAHLECEDSWSVKMAARSNSSSWGNGRVSNRSDYSQAGAARRSKDDSARDIKVQVRNSLALPERAATAATLPCTLKTVFGELFADEKFVTLLQAESLTTIPSHLRQVFDEAKTRHEVA